MGRTFTGKTRYFVKKNAPFTPAVIAYGIVQEDMTIGYIGFEFYSDYVLWVNQK